MKIRHLLLIQAAFLILGLIDVKCAAPTYAPPPVLIGGCTPYGYDNDDGTFTCKCR